MRRTCIASLLLFACIIAASVPLAYSQQFPIAVGPDSTLSLSATFDGTNYLVGVQGDTLSPNNMTAQRVSRSGALVGPRISLGRRGALFAAGPIGASDGVRSLLVWTDKAGPDSAVYGRFVEPSGNLPGPSFPIAVESAGVPLQCEEPADFTSFRIGLFGLDKLQNIARTVASFAEALNRIA